MNKNHSNFYAFVAILSALIILFLNATLYIKIISANNENFSEKTNSFKPYKVVLDAGHGGVDGGAVGYVSNVKESDLNLLIVFELKRQLENHNFQVALTRKNKDGLYGASIVNFKKRDMKARRDIIIREKPDIMCSIHLNKYSSALRSGAQVFYKAKETTGLSKSLACEIQNQLNKSVNNRSYAALSGDYYMLNCTSFTSVIVECGFLSNPTDEANLLKEDYRKMLAEKICIGIMSFFVVNYKNTSAV